VETLGAYLKGKREALQVSLQEVAQVTRIRRSILEAIENNRYDLLPPKVFAQGFVKSYASYLGLDESEVVKRYAELVEAPEAEARTAEARMASSASRFSSIIKLFVLIALILAAALLWRMSSRDNNVAEFKPKQQAGLTTTSLITMTTVPGEPVAAASGKEPASAPPVIGATGSPATAVVERLTPAAGAPQPSAPEQPLTATVVSSPDAAVPEKPPAAAAAAPLVLTIVASQNTWMRIQSDTKRPIEFTLKGGQTRSVDAMEKFIIRIGNAGGVDLFLNGQELGKPGKPGEVLQLTLPE
jgi:cytoskeleton protein RodZ